MRSYIQCCCLSWFQCNWIFVPLEAYHKNIEKTDITVSRTESNSTVVRHIEDITVFVIQICSE